MERDPFAQRYKSLRVNNMGLSYPNHVRRTEESGSGT